MDNIPLDEILPVPPASHVDFAPSAHAEAVHTSKGTVHVTIVGDRTRVPFFAYHDVGTNHRTCFGAFVNHPDVQPVLAHVCLYCVDATGSEDDAETCTRSPSSVKELVQQLHEVATHFRLDKALVFGIGVGLGGTVLLNYALEYGAHVGGIVLVSADWRPLGWADYAFYTQMHAALAYVSASASFAHKQLLTRYFSAEAREEGRDIVTMHAHELERMNAGNVAQLLAAYMVREDVSARLGTLRARVLAVVGSESGNREAMQDLVGALPKDQCSLVEVKGAGGLVTEERPSALAEPLRLFLQGFGYCLPQLNSRLRALNDESSSGSDDESGKSSGSD